MKTQISRIGKSSLSVILSVMMIISTMLVGTLSANAASETFTANSTLYIDIGTIWEENYKNNVSVPYVTFSNNDNDYSNPISRVKLTDKVSGTIYKVTVPNNQGVRAFRLERAQYANQTAYWDNMTTTASSRSNDSNNLFTIKDWNTTVGWSTYSTSSGDNINADLLSVLKGEKIMFYAGVSWTTDVGLFDQMVTASGITAKYSKTADKSLSANGKNYNFALFTVPQATYYIGALDYAPREVATVAGGTYLLANSKITATGFSLAHQWDYGGNWLHSYSASGANSTANVSCDTEISKGSTLSVTNNTDAGKSTIGKTNTFEYYILNKSNNKFTKVSLSSGKIDTSSLEVGNYTLKTVLKDENGLYVVAASNDFSVKELTKYTATVNANEGGTITAPSGGSATVDAGTKLNITASPNNGFKFSTWSANPSNAVTFSSANSASTPVTINGDVTLTASFALQNPSVSLNADANTANIGNSVTLTPSVTKYDGITYSEPTFTVEKGGTTVTASDYIKGSSSSGYTFSTPTDKDAKGTYTITVSYTASKDGFTSQSNTSSVTITVNPSAYQTAFETIVSNLSDTTNYPIPSTISGEYKKSTYDAYKTAYEAAKSAVDGKSYPAAEKGASDPDYVTLSTNLIHAKAALVAKQTLPQPTLSADPAIITSGTYSTLTISNYAQYPDGTVFEFYKTTDTAAAIATVTKSGSNTGTAAISGTTLDLGTHSYYVKVTSYNTDDYICSDTQSANATIEKKTGITVSVNAGANGSAYISKYTDLSGEAVTNTDTSLTNVSALSGYSVEFTAVPDANYEVSKWNGTTNSSKTYTLSNVTANTDVSVEFAESKDVYFYIAVSYNWDISKHPDVSGASKVGTSAIYDDVALYNGTSEINGFDKKFKVYIYKAVEGTSVRIGASDYGQTVTPKSGYCYYYGTINSNNGFGTINAMTLTAVNATSSVAALVKGSAVNLSVKASDHNGKTAGQDAYTVHYKVTKDDVVVHSGSTASFTPSESGSYVVEAYAVDNTSGKISTNTVKKTIEVYDSLPSFKVEFGSSNDTMGTVTATAGGTAIKSGDTVVAGTQVSFKYDNKDASKYDFIGWYDNPEGTGTQLAAHTPYTRTISADTKVYAVFGGKASNYRLAKKDGNSYTSLGNFRATDNDNEYVLSVNLNEGDKFNFYIETSASGTPNPNYSNNSGDYFSNNNFTGNSLQMYHWGDSAPCPEFVAEASGTYVFTWKLDIDNGGTLSVKRPVSDTVNVIAKDGTIRANYQKYADMADTKLKSGVTGIDSTPTYYEKAKAKKGGTITIQTTINSTNMGTYYVKAFCINGESYGIITKSDAEAHKSDGVYTCTYAIPDDLEDNVIEITPIYYFFDDQNTVNFYVEGFTDQIKEYAGDTIACYAFYSDDSEALGGYPGQPFINDGGRLYMQIPKTYNGSQVSGITLNNYVWDDIHSGRVVDGTGDNRRNVQTYDYNSFLKLNEVKKATDIFFNIKYRTAVNNNPGDTFGNEDSYENGWEDLTNHFGALVDIYDNKITTDTTGKDVLHVVSNGYIENTSQQKYATEWSVYAPDGRRVGKISPSALLEDDVSKVPSSYQKTYEDLAKYKDYPVKISYEQAAWNTVGADSANGGKTTGGDQALRMDGRWTYVNNEDYAEARVRIEYADNLNSDFVEDPFLDNSNVGTTTGTKAYFTNKDFNGKTTSGSVRVNPDEYFTFAAENDPNNEYMFIGWWRLANDGTYTQMTDARSQMLGNDTFVARFIKTPEGNLGVRHQLYTGDPDKPGVVDGVLGGQGNCYVKVEIMDGDTVIATYGNTTSATSASIDKKYIRADSPYTMIITLTTVMKGNNLFKGTYRLTDTDTKYELVSNTSDNNSTGVVTTVRNYPISNLFKYADGTLAGEQLINSINYYSNIQSVNREYKITFNYDDRFGAPQKYVVKGILPEGQTGLTKEYVMSKAPYEKNFMKDFVWNDESINLIDVGDTSTAEVYAIQTPTQVAVHFNTEFITDGAYNETLFFDYGSLVTVNGGDHGTQLWAPETNPQNANEKFSHWEICNDDGDFVTNVYSRWFNYVLYDNYYIKPIYKQTPDSITTSGISATIQFLEYSRNQWTDDNGNMAADGSDDRIFADFALAFTKNGELINPAQNECGIVLAVGPTIDGKTPDNVTFTTDEAKLKNFIKNGIQYTSDGGNGTVKVVKPNSITKLDNKNRVEIYNRFKNSSANTAPVIKAYSYIIDDNGEVVLSDPVNIRLYEESVKTYTYNADNAA